MKEQQLLQLDQIEIPCYVTNSSEDFKKREYEELAIIIGRIDEFYIDRHRRLWKYAVPASN